MKAWVISDRITCFSSTIVFAPTRGKALSIASNLDQFEDVPWVDLRAKRFKSFDRYYTGRDEIDWYSPEVRIILVRDYGWACEETSIMCNDCAAKEWCSRWEDME